MRAGRFDMLLHVAPPTWIAKLEHLDVLYRAEPEEVQKSKKTLSTWTGGRDEEAGLLDLFTVAEAKSLLEHIRRVRSRDRLSEAFGGWSQTEFLDLVRKWGHDVIVLRHGSDDRAEFDKDKTESALQ